MPFCVMLLPVVYWAADSQAPKPQDRFYLSALQFSQTYIFPPGHNPQHWIGWMENEDGKNNLDKLTAGKSVLLVGSWQLYLGQFLNLCRCYQARAVILYKPIQNTALGPNWNLISGSSLYGVEYTKFVHVFLRPYNIANYSEYMWSYKPWKIQTSKQS